MKVFSRQIIGLLLLVVLSAVSCRAAENRPLLMVSGSPGYSDAPGSFIVFYADGRVIYRVKESAKYPVYKYKLARLKNTEAIVAALLPKDLPTLKGSYELSAATDQAGTEIWHPGGSISIYGDWQAPRQFDADFAAKYPDTVASEKSKWETLPASVRYFLKSVYAAVPVEGEAWHPNTIEVSFSPTSGSIGEPLIWPSNWPNLNDPSAEKDMDGFTSITLPFHFFKDVDEFHDKTLHGRAVLINGQRMNMWIRLPIPGEKAWRKVFKTSIVPINAFPSVR